MSSRPPTGAAIPRRSCLNGRARRRAGALIVALVTLLVIMGMMAAVLKSLTMQHRQSRQALAELQSLWLADSAAARAAAQLRRDGTYSGEVWRVDLNSSDESKIGVAEIQVERTSPGAEEVRVTLRARYPDDATRRVISRRSFQLNIPKTNQAAAN